MANSKHKTESIQNDVFIEVLVKYRQISEMLRNYMIFVEEKKMVNDKLLSEARPKFPAKGTKWIL